MKAETVFNIAVHLNDYELKRLNSLISLRLKTKKVEKKSFKTDEEIQIRLIKLCFSKIKK